MSRLRLAAVVVTGILATSAALVTDRMRADNEPSTTTRSAVTTPATTAPASDRSRTDRYVVPAERISGAYLNWADRPNFVEPDDSLGVPVVWYGPTIGDQLNPVTIAQWGLQGFSRWVTYGDETGLHTATAAAEWLLANQGRDGAWRYAFAYDPSTGVMPPGWASALAQGNAMSLLVRLFGQSNDRRYLDAAVAATSILEVPVEEGGVLRLLDGDTWFEEYPTDVPTHVLNGLMFTLVGLWDLATYDDHARALYDAGRSTLERSLHRWNRGDGLPPWYDLRHEQGYPPKYLPDYDWLHEGLLIELQHERQSPEIVEALSRWYP